MNGPGKLVDEHGAPVATPPRAEVFVPGALAAGEIQGEMPPPEPGEEPVEKLPLVEEARSGKWLFPEPGIYLVRNGELPIKVADERQALVMAGKAQEKWGPKKWAIMAVQMLQAAMPEPDARRLVAEADKKRRKK